MTHRDVMLFRRGASRLIALHGGWNDRSRRAVLWLAARHSIPASEIAALLTLQAANAPAGGAEQSPVLRSPAMSHGFGSVPDRNTALLAGLFIASLVSLVLTIGIALIVLPPALGQRGETGTATSDAQSGDAAVAGGGASDAPVGSPVSVPTTTDRPVDTAEREASDAATLLALLDAERPIDAVSADIERALTGLAGRWLDADGFTRREHRAALSSAFMRLLASGSHDRRAMGVLETALAPLVQERLPGAQAAGGLSESELRIAVLAADVADDLDPRRSSAWVAQRLRVVRERVSPSGDGLFRGAITQAALAIRPPANGPGIEREMARSRESWSAWLEAVDAAAGTDEGLRSVLLLAGLSALVTGPPAPADSTAAAWAMRDVASALRWRASSPERAWLTRAIIDPQVGTESLYLITGAMVASSAPGVDSTMVVPRGASAGDRASMLDRFNAAWGLGSSMELTGFVGRWSDVVRGAAQINASAPAAAQLEHAVRMARLSAAAGSAIAGDFDRADALLVEARAEPDQLSATPDEAGRGFDPSTGPRDGSWGVEFLSLDRDTAARLELLRRVPRRPDAIDAEVLVGAALRDPASGVRSAAATLVRAMASEPAIVNALLEAAPSMPRTPSASSLVADVTATAQFTTRDPQWRAKIRRVLVERLNELIGERRYGLSIETGVQTLASLYAERAGGRRGAASDDPATEAAGLLESLARRAPGGYEQEALARRLAIARNDPQRLVAHQRSIIEALASIAIDHRPDRAEDVRSMVDARLGEVERAEHVLEQIARLEALAAELWLVRVGDGS